MKKLFLIGVLACAGCASSSGVHKSGPDTFTVSASASPGAGGNSKAKSTAYQEATQECAKQQRGIEIVKETPLLSTDGSGVVTVDLVFRCSPTPGTGV